MVNVSCYFERQEEDITTVTFFQVTKSNKTQGIIIFIAKILSMAWFDMLPEYLHFLPKSLLAGGPALQAVSRDDLSLS